MTQAADTKRNSLRATIHGLMQEIAESNQVKLVNPIEDDTVLLETGLDSLGFAILVTRLEQELGYDPFSMMETPYYPRTFGEFVEFYEQSAPR